MTIALQVTIKLYCNGHLGDVFLSFIIVVFGCLHPHVKNFFHRCANDRLKVLEVRPSSLMLRSFYK
jgi:hypothetical protein